MTRIFAIHQCDCCPYEDKGWECCKLPTLADILAPLRAEIDSEDDIHMSPSYRAGLRKSLELLDKFSKGELDSKP